MTSRKKKIAIVDANGMSGHIISKYLNSTGKYHLYNFDIDDVLFNDSIEIEDLQVILQSAEHHDPDIIINCARILVEESEENPEKSIMINSYLPHYLSKLPSKIIQLSTDCVFSGKKGDYNDYDIKDGTSNYAKSKSLGELNNEKDLTIRTSFIGPNIKNRNEELFHWFFNQKGTVQGFTNVFWSGVTSLELAKAIEFAIDNDITGLVHLTNGQKISKFDLLMLINKIWDLGIDIRKRSDVVSDKSLTRTENLNYNVASYDTMFSDLYQWMMDHIELYNDYISR